MHKPALQVRADRDMDKCEATCMCTSVYVSIYAYKYERVGGCKDVI